MRPLTVGSLFAGIGGFDLGFERAGFEIRWQVEIDPFCRRVLEKHWPNVRRYEDIRHCTTKERAEREMHDMAASGCGDAPSCPVTYHGLEPVDVICGGFPCQDISFAGSGEGLDGERSGLWREFDRLVGVLRPRVVVVENSAALTARGLGRILGDLAGRGFDAEWACISACAFGAPHPRRRVFIVAYADGEHGRARVRDSFAQAFRPLQSIDGFESARARYRERLADPSALYGGADGIPDGPHRNHAIGNAVMPEITEWIARRIHEAETLALESR
jgi:DNA (cytosine-5)-methyltransferase 1